MLEKLGCDTRGDKNLELCVACNGEVREIVENRYFPLMGYHVLMLHIPSGFTYVEVRVLECRSCGSRFPSKLPK